MRLQPFYLTLELSVALTCCCLTCGAEEMSLEAVSRGSQQERFLLFFPGVRWGKKNSGLCCEATVPNFNLEECLNPEKKLRRRLSITSLVTTRG